MDESDAVGAGSGENGSGVGRQDSLLADFFNLSGNLLGILDYDGLFRRVNPALRRALGPDHDGQLRPYFYQFVHREDVAETREALEELRSTGGSVSFENRFLIQDGTYRWMQWNVSLDADRELLHASAHDVTERRQQEEELRRSEDRFHSLISATAAIVWSTPADGQFHTVQPEWSAFTGQSWEEYRGTGWLAAVHPEDREQTVQNWLAAVHNRQLYQVEHRLKRRDGQYRYMQVRGVPILDRENEATEWIGIHSDITDRKEVEEATRRTEKFMTSLVENIPHMIFVKDAVDLRFVRFNKAGEELLGIPRDQMIGKSDYDFFPPEEVEFFIAKDRAVLDGRQIVDIAEEPIQTAHGTRLLHTKKIPILDEKGEPQYMLGISEDITERKQTELELYRAKESAEKANRSKSEFLANMSHELRTPLNAIIGFSEVLEDQTFGELNARQLRYVSNILTSGQHLLQLINDILDIAKIEAGRLHLDVQQFPVAQAIDGVVNVVRALANKKGLTLNVNCTPDLPLLHADQAKFKQILYNLISNAIKFTPQGGQVTIEAYYAPEGPEGAHEGHLQEPGICLQVTDNGIGIKQEDQGRVFKEFEQVDSSYSREQQGTGLGLALTRNLVEMHGGTIWLESAGQEGLGSTFTFYLPLWAQVPGEASQPAPAINFPAGGVPRPPAPLTRNSHPDPQSAPLVLVVEDDAAAGDLLELYLTEANYRVKRIGDGKAVLPLVRELQPDALTLDIMLPGQDGWQVLKELKADASTAAIPVVIVSMTQDRQLGFSLGAIDFVVKPTEKCRVLEAIQRALRSETAAGHLEPGVLVIDDEPLVLEYLKDMLEEEGIRVRTAGNGRLGLQLARQEPPRVLVLDLMMPGMNGFEVLQELRRDPCTAAISVIIFSAHELSLEDKERLGQDIRSLVPKTARQELLSELQKLALGPGKAQETHT